MVILGRKIRVRYLLMVDIFLTIVSILASYILRLELVAVFPTYTASVLWMIGLSILIKPIIYYFFGMYRRVWRYASMRELMMVLTATTVASMAIAALMISLFALNAFRGFPRSVLIIDWLMSVLLIGASRFSSRILAENRVSGAALKPGRRMKSVLVVGAGDAGVMVVRELQKNPQLNIEIIGFLDDDPEKQKIKIYGVPVIAPLSELNHILRVRQIDEVIIAIPSAPGSVIRHVTQVCQQNRVPSRTMPAIYELLDGKVNVSRLREVEIEDLLRREPTRINSEAIGSSIEAQVVMVTGAGGSIGRELCRQIASHDPKQILLLGHGENSIFEALLELKEAFPATQFLPIIADVRDANRLKTVFEKYHPDLVFHAAAHKHVPMMEMNIEEAVTNNVLGTYNVVNACINAGVERLVMISTDKAVRPANIMGATKRFAEMIVIDAAQRTGKAYSVVRFGNVLGSRGSVVPRFKQQIAKGGPITITHPEMKRYFMTIPEAVHLVLQASIMSLGAETFVLDMGEQVRILDLAKDLIKLSGLEPGKDIEIEFLGMRPGEKLSEDLWDEVVMIAPTAHPDVYKVAEEEKLSSEKMEQAIDELLSYAQNGQVKAIIQLIEEMLPSASLQGEPLDLTIIS